MFRFSSSEWQRFSSCCSLPSSGDEGKPGNDFRRVNPVFVILTAPLGAFLSEWAACSWSKPETILAGAVALTCGTHRRVEYRAALS